MNEAAISLLVKSLISRDVKIMAIYNNLVSLFKEEDTEFSNIPEFSNGELLGYQTVLSNTSELIRCLAQKSLILTDYMAGNYSDSNNYKIMYTSAIRAQVAKGIVSNFTTLYNDGFSNNIFFVQSGKLTLFFNFSYYNNTQTSSYIEFMLYLKKTIGGRIDNMGYLNTVIECISTDCYAMDIPTTSDMQVSKLCMIIKELTGLEFVRIITPEYSKYKQVSVYSRYLLFTSEEAYGEFEGVFINR